MATNHQEALVSARIEHAPAFPILGQHRSLVWELAKREVFGRYRGASLGMFWSLLSPFLMLAVYSIAFGQILRARWPGVESSSDFAFVLFVGLIIHGFFAECLTRAPLLVSGNPNFVKRIVFPLEVLPWPALLSALFHLGVNFVVFAIGLWLIRGHVPLTIVLVPLVILPLVFIALGCLWLLGALGVYLRDIGQLTGPVATALLFLSSAIVPVDSLPDNYRWLFRINPLTSVIDGARAVAFQGSMPDGLLLLAYSFGGLSVALLGYLTFRRLRGGFADVL